VDIRSRRYAGRGSIAIGILAIASAIVEAEVDETGCLIATSIVDPVWEVWFSSGAARGYW
jgi:hypothetical protein